MKLSTAGMRPYRLRLALLAAFFVSFTYAWSVGASIPAGPFTAPFPSEFAGPARHFLAAHILGVSSIFALIWIGRPGEQPNRWLTIRRGIVVLGAIAVGRFYSMMIPALF